jgi:hypothetical protein
VFNTSAGNTGHDTITDFAPGQDKINLDYAAFTSGDTNSFNAWLTSHSTVSGSDLLIDLNPDNHHANLDTILLKNVTLANLHAGDFIVHGGGTA